MPNQINLKMRFSLWGKISFIFLTIGLTFLQLLCLYFWSLQYMDKISDHKKIRLYGNYYFEDAYLVKILQTWRMYTASQDVHGFMYQKQPQKGCVLHLLKNLSTRS